MSAAIKHSLFFALCAACSLFAQENTQWSFDHIGNGASPSLFFNNQHSHQLDASAHNGAMLAATKDGQYVLDAAAGTFHRNVSSFYSPRGDLGMLKVPFTLLPKEGSFTLEGFVRFPSQENIIFARQVDYNPNARHGFEVGIRPDGTLQSRIDVLPASGRGNFGLRGPLGTRANNGQWHHFAFVYDDSSHTATLYLDGKPGTPLQLPAALKRPNRDLIAGKLYAKDTELWLDELRLSNRALLPEHFLKMADNPADLRESPSVTNIASIPLMLEEVVVQPGQWGIRPIDGMPAQTTPPSFVWQPQAGISMWELEVINADGEVIYTFADNPLTAHRPSRVFTPGSYTWHYRGKDNSGRTTPWSPTRTFHIEEDTHPFALPTKAELLARIPTGHPRLFLTPDNIDAWRQRVRGDQAESYAGIRESVGQWLEKRPDTREPAPFAPDEKIYSAPWYKRWQSNTRVTREAATAAYLMGFVAQMENDDTIAAAGVSIFNDLIRWDPKGSTSWAQSSEASYAYLYGLARAYTLLYPWLGEEDRALAQEHLRERTNVYYQRMLARNHLWAPFGSHENRIWHFIGEAALALHGEVPEADDWLWFAMNVFANVYPVWGAQDGGWHEGTAYHASYMHRFFWWVVIMKEALDINAFESLPFFRNAGDFVIYTMPPNKTDGGLGDQAELSKANTMWNYRLLRNIANLGGNGYYQGYAEKIRQQLGDTATAISDLPLLFLEAYPMIPAKDFTQLPTSKVFRDTGQVVFNSTLEDATQSVQVQFKASEFYGSFSHGYEANNTFLVWAYGKRMLIKTGFRDSFGSDHHKHWMWSTRSTNNITLGGKGQFPRSMLARATLVDSLLEKSIDAAASEASQAYFQEIGKPSLLERYTRALVFIKPATLVVVDYLRATSPQSFEYWLHAQKAFKIEDGNRLLLDNDGVTMDARLLAPQPLALRQTDQYDPNPHDHITLREWHLTATTGQPQKAVRFIAAYTFAPAGASAASLDYTLEEQGEETLLCLRDKDGSITRLAIPQLRNDAPTRESIVIKHRDAGQGSDTVYRLLLSAQDTPAQNTQ